MLGDVNWTTRSGCVPEQVWMGHRPETGTVPVNFSRCERYTNEWNGTGTGPEREPEQVWTGPNMQPGIYLLNDIICWLSVLLIINLQDYDHDWSQSKDCLWQMTLSTPVFTMTSIPTVKTFDKMEIKLYDYMWQTIHTLGTWNLRTGHNIFSYNIGGTMPYRTLVSKLCHRKLMF